MTRTARMVAAFRGWATDHWPEIVHDPFARALGGDEGEKDALVYVEAHPHMPLYMALRTAVLDDEVRVAMARGVRQIVILGAGYDARAARLRADGVHFFEVDLPSTQVEKRAQTAKVAGYPEAAARYVRCDFEKDDFLERLTAEGFDPTAPALVLWEGVVYYLTEKAVRATLHRVASGMHPSSRIVFDLIGKRFVDGEITDAKEKEARELVARMGEPLHFGTNDVLPILFAEGFRYVDVRSFDEIALRYTGTYDRVRTMRFQSLAAASVAAPARPDWR
jgi:methyltransferase (TIGR00027 family)